MNGHRYLVYDVFTDRRLAGNPLAIVLDADDLDTPAMQTIAREFNLSESVFVQRAEKPVHRARIRIFTPDYEMPFAGHPTVGSAVALAELDGNASVDGVFVLEENIGPVRCAVSRGGAMAFAEFDLARLPEPLPLSATPEAVGAALGLDPHEIGFENHRVSYFSAGVPYVTIPVRDQTVAAKIRLDNHVWAELAPKKSEWAFASPYVYCRAAGADTAFHVRMIVPGNPSYEDPATGSAAAAFAGAIMRFDAPVDGMTRFWIEQGIEMGRPSRIRLELDVEGGGLKAGRIGGNAVKVAEGRLLV